MTTTNMPVKQMTASVSKAQESVERSSVGTYTLHNDTDSHVTIFRTAGEQGPPIGVCMLAPGADSESFDDGSFVAIRYGESGYAAMATWNNSLYTLYYNAEGQVRPNQVNNVSSFG
ncbi:hypothetical protein AB0H00_27405 [Nocardia sp. NPDC023852]|uniref:hypothetical protein n=1 Tax=Nocardia sp. NPDC023852 TaxID=3154697 RepID=UPI0033F41BBF